MNAAEEQQLFTMVKEIYHHLGLDGERPISLNHLRDKAEKDILKWREKKRIRKYEREKP
ncbi:MAG: hypothetical protein ABFD75_12040 [Smithella sp.]